MITSWNGIILGIIALCEGNSPVTVNSHHKGQWRWALMFSLICDWTNGWVNNGEAGDLRRHRAHHDVTVMRRWIPLSCTRLTIYWSISQQNYIMLSCHRHIWYDADQVSQKWQVCNKTGIDTLRPEQHAFFLLKIFVFCFKFHWDLFPLCQLTKIDLCDGC